MYDFSRMMTMMARGMTSLVLALVEEEEEEEEGR